MLRATKYPIAMNAETDPLYEGLLGICKNNTAAVVEAGNQMRNIQSELDTLRVMVHMLSARSQLPSEAVVALMTKLQAAFYQRRLEALEDQNPAAAAQADTRQGIPDLDPEIMELLRRACEEGGGLE
jgi:hypothetical protein